MPVDPDLGTHQSASAARERCDGTFTFVFKGRVDVRDKHIGRIVHLHAHQGHLARAD